MNVGSFSRRGRSRTGTKAADHDFKPEATLTPFGILLPERDDLTVYMARSKVTGDFIVDRLEEWWEFNRIHFSKVKKLVLNLDDGPEDHSRRPQFLNRLVEFAQTARLDVELAYYPPCLSKYNPIERCWGIPELHRNGALLDSVQAVLGYAATMTWKGGHPEVVLVETQYNTGARLSPKEMEALESQVRRFATLEKWFVSIPGRRRKQQASQVFSDALDDRKQAGGVLPILDPLDQVVLPATVAEEEPGRLIFGSYVKDAIA